MTVFQCPDCFALHQEPLDASYVVGVRCAFCTIEAERQVLRAAGVVGASPRIARAA